MSDPENQPIARYYRNQLRAYSPFPLFTSTQSYTAECPAGGVGLDVTVSRTAESSISQADANSKALYLARAESEMEIVCQFTSQRCEQAPCYLYPTICVTAMSMISQADADAQAALAARAAAVAHCS